MIRRTSHDTYNQIKKNGLLSHRRQEVYELLYEFGPCTAMELAQNLLKSRQIDSHIRARLNELRELGCAYEVTERPCRVTGMTVIVWDVTEFLPRKKKLIPGKIVRCDKCHHILRGKR